MKKYSGDLREDCSEVLTEPKVKISHELQKTWKEADKHGIAIQSFLDLLQQHHTKESKKIKTTTAVYRYCIKCFDIIWTCVLLMILLYLLIVYIPPINKSIQTHLHDKIYTIHRLTRFAFLSLHPHLLTFGIDLTKICLIENPLVNDTQYCPCIGNRSPIDITSSSSSSLSSHSSIVDAISSDKITIIHNYLIIEEFYGRPTLLKYVSKYHQNPSACLHNVMGKTGPNVVDDIVSDNKWKGFQESQEPWGYMWHDCYEFPSLRTLLPQLSGDIKEHNITLYTLLTRWEKALSYEFNDIDINAVVLVVLQGTIRVKIEPARHCIQYCIELLHQRITMNEGDILIYDKRYWLYNVRSWSETTFLMTVPVNKISATE